MCQSGKRGQRSLPRPVASHTRLKFHRNLLNKSTLLATAINPWDVLHYCHVREGGNRPFTLGPRTGPPTIAARASPATAGPAGPGSGWLLHRHPPVSPCSPQCQSPRRNLLQPRQLAELPAVPLLPQARGWGAKKGPQECSVVDFLLSVYYILQLLANSFTLPRRRC